MGDVARDVERYGIDAYLGLCEERVLRRFMQLYGGDRSMIARKLNITVRSLRYRLGKYGLVSQSDDETWRDES